VTPGEARRRLRIIGATTRETACPACGAAERQPCPASPVIGHSARFYAAAKASADRHGRYPPDFERLAGIFASAYPVPADGGHAEAAPGGHTVLWRAAPAQNAHFGRGSYWTHSRRWAEAIAASFCVFGGNTGPLVREAGPSPYVLYRAEVRLTDRNTCWYGDGRLDTSTVALDRAIQGNPTWPGRSWLLFREPDPLQKNLPGYSNLLQYVYAGKRPIKAARPG